MVDTTVLVVGLGITIIWLLSLTMWMTRLYRHYHRLTYKTKKKELISILDELLSTMTYHQRRLETQETQVQRLEHRFNHSLHQVGFVRFNPFADTGGNQSFILALLNKDKTGMMISSLHNRETTRVYAKQLVKGESKDFPLSEEEKKVVDNTFEVKA